MTGRFQFLLDGNWLCLPDPKDEGRAKGFFEANLSDSSWNRMKIPSNWHLEDLKDYCGIVWFRHHFKAPKELEAKNVRLRFDGVDYFADVWLNGVFLGGHEGYFAPFDFDITDVLKFGEENLLAVRVDSPLEEPEKTWPNHKRLIKGVYNHHDCRPGGNDPLKGQDGNTGGIWNHVELIGTGPFAIDHIAVSSNLLPGGSAHLIIDMEIENFCPKPEMARLKVQIEGVSFESKKTYTKVKETLLQPGRNTETMVLKVDKPRFWWPWDHGKPDLYNLFARVGEIGKVSDQVKLRFGIRSVKVKDWCFYLNNRRIFLRGTNYIATQWLSEMDKEKYRKDARLLKDANINAIRVHAHVERPELLEVCDEEGILVWQDFPLIWGYDTSNEFIANAVKQIREMIKLYYNHPSIIVWCCHNEPPKYNLNELDTTLHQTALRADSTRYIDIASTNEYHPYYGWYVGHYKKYSELPGKPFVNEFGAQALPCLETMKAMFKPVEPWPPKWDVWAYHNFQRDQTFNVARIQMGKSIEEFIQNSQEYQAKLIKFAIECYRRAKYNPMTGIFQFMFVDCWPSITWAVLDYYRRPKEAYYTLKKTLSPILVSIQCDREVFTPGNMVEGSLWIINDFYKDYREAKVEWKIVDQGRRILHEKRFIVDIERDSITPVKKFRWLIPPEIPLGNYQIKSLLKDSTDGLLSENEHAFIIKR